MSRPVLFLLWLLIGFAIAAMAYCTVSAVSVAFLLQRDLPAAAPVRPQYLQPIPLYRLPNFQPPRHAS